MILTGENPKYLEIILCSVPLYCAYPIWQTNCELTPHRSSILQELAACLLVKIFFPFMDLESSLPYSQKLPTGLCREPKEPRHELFPNLVKIRFSKLLLILCLLDRASP